MRLMWLAERPHDLKLTVPADESPQVVEGHWDRDKVVLISFPDEAAFRSWADSPEYQDISKDRQAGADTVVLLVKGLA